MKLFLKVTLYLIFFFLALLLFMIGEGKYRAHFGERGEIKINGLPIDNVSAEGSWNTDFMMSGYAWRIKVKTDKHLQILIDGEEGKISPGTHKIFYNHDITNRNRYGFHRMYKVPQHVELRKLEVLE